jgi:hypothetical protein
MESEASPAFDEKELPASTEEEAPVEADAPVAVDEKQLSAPGEE